MKATKRFSYQDKSFDEGDEVDLDDEALEKLKTDGLVSGSSKKKKEDTGSEAAESNVNEPITASLTEQTTKVESDVKEKKNITKPGTGKY